MGEEAKEGVGQFVKNYGAIVASVLQLIGVMLYIAHWQATVDQRLGTVETQQATISSNMDRLNTAREADQIHLAHVDDKLGDMYAKVSAMFNILTGPDTGDDQQPADAQPGQRQAPPGNFPRPQGRRN